jgi:16S rRNA (guanine527-N7)-methyltransferase
VSAFGDRLQELVGADVQLTSEQLARLEQHFDSLRRWNRKLNLTAVRDDEEAIQRHYAESVYFAHTLCDFPAGLKVADVGSGAGFPGVVVAVMYPNWAVTLVEAHQRKAVFLGEVSRELPNIKIVAKRAEGMQVGFNLLISRAVLPEDVLSLVPRLAPEVALLVSTKQAEALSRLPMYWHEPRPLPWASAHVVLRGTVPRGTVV